MMTPQWMDHSNPKVQNVKAAQDIMHRAYDALRTESRMAGRKVERERARDASDKVMRALVYLSEELRTDSACWTGSEVA